MHLHKLMSEELTLLSLESRQRSVLGTFHGTLQPTVPANPEPPACFNVNVTGKEESPPFLIPHPKCMQGPVFLSHHSSSLPPGMKYIPGGAAGFGNCHFPRTRAKWEQGLCSPLFYQEYLLGKPLRVSLP